MPKTSEDQLTNLHTFSAERQRLLDTLAHQPFDTVTELCEAAEVSRHTYYNALEDQNFVKALFRDSHGLIYTNIPQVVKKIVEQAKRGSFVHQKLLLEMVKLYQSTDGGLTQNNTFIVVRGEYAPSTN
jgi:hypothetical protein